MHTSTNHDFPKPLDIVCIDFVTSNTISLYLSNERTVLVPLDKFQPIANLTPEQRNDFEIIDYQHLSFLAIDEVYSLGEFLGIE